jgi:hypothetical protein
LGGIGSAIERRGISEFVRNGRSLRSRGVQKVTPCLQVGTQIVRHGVEWRRVKKRVKNEMKYVWNELKPWGEGGIYRVVGDKI